MARKEITTSIKIAASPKKVWDILTDFSAYKDWNPFLTSIEGDFKVGKQVKITAGGMPLEPLVLAYEPEKEIRWLGKLFFKGIFDGEHIFQIIDNQDGSSTFKHNEQFSGILVPLFAQKLDTDIRANFEEMNRRLKQLAEETPALK